MTKFLQSILSRIDFAKTYTFKLYINLMDVTYSFLSGYYTIYSDLRKINLNREKCIASNTSCDWYHPTWKIFKTLNIVSTSIEHKKRYLLCLQHLQKTISPLKKNNLNILISGSTDESLLKILYCHYGLTIKTLNIFILDQCNLALEYSQSFAKKNGFEVNLIKSDILKLQEYRNKFDIIFSHAFLGYFTNSEKNKVVAKWNELLKPNGFIITIQRLRPGVSNTIMSFSDYEKSVFLEKVSHRTRWMMLSVSQKSTLHKLAHDFVNNFKTYPVTSFESFLSFFVNANLELIYVDYHSKPQSRAQKLNDTGPSVKGSTNYVTAIFYKNSLTKNLRSRKK